MAMWTAIVLIVLIGSIASIMRGRQNAEWKAWRERSQMPAEPSDSEQELQAEVTALKERIKVLERIATEDLKARRIADEINDLRKE